MSVSDRFAVITCLALGVACTAKAVQLHDWLAGRTAVSILAIAFYYLVVDTIANAIEDAAKKKCTCSQQPEAPQPSDNPASQ